MNFMQRVFPSRVAELDDDKFDEAMRLTDEVEQTLQKTAEDPFTVVALEIARSVFQNGADPALVADAYEANQEARIFLGSMNEPPKGR